MTVYITEAEVKQIHDDLEAVSSGIPGMRQDNIDYIIYVSQMQANSSDQPLSEFASQVLGRIAKGHPFADLNKRTAYFTARYFLMRNGADFNGASFRECADEVVGIAEASDMDPAIDLSRQLCSRDLVSDGVIIPDYTTFHRLVIKSIGVAKELADK